jgi:hypothetical protein
MNNSNPDDALDALFHAARGRRSDTSAAEFAFETRLMARLRAQPESSSVWAMVSWRLVPFFAACVAALAIWQAQVTSETNDAVAFTQMDSGDSVDSVNSN